MGSKFFAAKLLVTCQTPASVAEQTDSLRGGPWTQIAACWYGANRFEGVTSGLVQRSRRRVLPFYQPICSVHLGFRLIYFCSQFHMCIGVFHSFPLLMKRFHGQWLAAVKTPPVHLSSQDGSCLVAAGISSSSSFSNRPHFRAVLILEHLRSRMDNL